MFITLKIPQISTQQTRIIDIQKNYNNVLKFTYNRIIEDKDISTKNLTTLQKQMNNITIDSHFLGSAQYEARQLAEKENIVFGGLKLFIQRCQNKITKEEFQIQKLLPIYSVGRVIDKGNRKFSISEDLKSIIFKFNKDEHIVLELPNLRKNLIKQLKKLYKLQQSKSIAITYKLDKNFVYLSFDNDKLSNYHNNSQIENRIMSLDLNPNYVGWSIIDWKSSEDFKIVDKGLISIKEINDKEKEFKNKKLSSSSKERVGNHNKRVFETYNISKTLMKKALHYHCSILSIEKLSIESKDNDKGKAFNKLVNNNWNRNKLVENLQKKCDELQIKFVEVLPNFSSFIGNLVYRNLNLPDAVLSSIEIGRRGFEFVNQYITKTKDKEKNIIFPKLESVKSRIVQSLEELNYSTPFDNLKELYYNLKNSRLKYRVSLEQINYSVFSLNHIKSQTKQYCFI